MPTFRIAALCPRDLCFHPAFVAHLGSRPARRSCFDPTAADAWPAKLPGLSDPAPRPSACPAVSDTARNWLRPGACSPRRRCPPTRRLFVRVPDIDLVHSPLAVAGRSAVTSSRQGEEEYPAGAGPSATFLIAAHDHPGSCEQQRFGGLEELFSPRCLVIAERACPAFGAAVDARILAVVKIAHVQDEGSSGHDVAVGAFRDLGKRPIGRIAARLDLPIDHPATGVAEHDNVVWLVRSCRQNNRADPCASLTY